MIAPIQFDSSSLKKIAWHEYAIRFFFGGVITAVTGILAKRYGPIFGGLFLAFPAIFPASATLLEKHVREKKQQANVPVGKRGCQAAALDARGAVLGSIGLVSFAVLIWKLLPGRNAAVVLFVALACWLIVSFALWQMHRSHLCRR